MELVVYSLYFFVAMFVLDLACNLVSGASELVKIKIGGSNGTNGVI